jgi:hypothetical protein
MPTYKRHFPTMLCYAHSEEIRVSENLRPKQRFKPLVNPSPSALELG